NFKDLTGQRFGRLEVLSRAGSDKHGRALWLCRCRCLATIEASTSALRQGRIGSCGCAYWEAFDRKRRERRFDQLIDRYDGFDPQIPDWKFVELQDYQLYHPAVYLDDVVETRELDPELLAALGRALTGASWRYSCKC